MRFRIPLTLLVCAPLASACQPLDSDAASGAQDEGDELPTAVDTPEIELANGDTTTDACEATTLQVIDVLTTNCAPCHGGDSPGARQGQPPFDYVLDFDKLQTARSANVPDPLEPDLGMRFVRPGDPENSRVYFRVWRGEMPPQQPIGLPELSRPTLSDVSLIYTWILSCM